jgi:flavodoxin
MTQQYRGIETMKARAGLFGIFTATLCLLAVSSSAQPIPANGQTVTGDSKILIVYLSRTNNTKAIAEMIQKKVGGALVALELEKPYPSNYTATVEQVARENEEGYLPPLKTKIDLIEQYDFVFLGFPTWGMQLPPPVKSFLRQSNLQGKTVIPFNTNAGYGTGSSFQAVKELCSQCKVLEGLVIKGGAERDGQFLVIQGATAKEANKDVENWLRKLNVPVARVKK